MPRSGFPGHRIPRPGARALTRSISSAKVATDRRELLGRTIQRALAILEVVEDADPGRDELLQEVGGLDLFPPESALLAHHEHLERQPRPYGIDQPDEAGPLREFRPLIPSST